MVFQNITFKHTHNEIDDSIRDYVTQKLTTLEKYIGEETDVKCDVEFDKVAPQNTGLICRVEINIWVKGVLYRAEATEATFTAAIDIVQQELDTEMNRAHKKRTSLIRAGGRKIKEMMRFGN